MPKSKLREADSRVPLSGETNEPIPKKWKLSADISSGAQNGLRNQGATCYLNSGLQILFMTKEFREGVLNSKRLKDSSNDNNLLNRLCQLFENLYDGHKPSGVSTVNITKALSIANVYEQQDAVEWFEKILNEVPEETSQVYKGILRKTLKCLTKLVEHADCEEDSTFFSIPLSIDADTCDVYNVDDGLKDFFQTTRSDEDDRMYCDDCDEKTDTEIRFNIQKYPTVLILHLKRFYFDYFQMGYQKNSCPMDIPLELDFFKDCPYDLYGIINHSGQYRGGHYDAYIKPPENNHWYCFDDSRVTEITDNNFLKGSRTAYMIVYRKRSSQIYLYEEINSLENTAEDALKTKAEDELQRREPLPSSHQQQNIMKTCTEGITATVNEVPKEMKSSPMAESPPCQNGFQAVAEDEMEKSEQRGESLPSSQEQNTMKKHTEDSSAVGIQERVCEEIKDSALAEIPRCQDASLAVAQDEMEMGEERGEYLPSSHQEQHTPKTFTEDTSAIVIVISEIGHSTPTVKGTNTRVPQPKEHQDERKEEMDINIDQPVKNKHRACGAGQEDEFSEDNPFLTTIDVENQAPLSRSTQDSVPATSTIVDIPEVSSPFIWKAPRGRRRRHAPYPCSKLKGKKAWVVFFVILSILLVSTLIILLWILLM